MANDSLIPLGSAHRLSRRQRLVTAYLGVLTAVIVAFTVLYWYGITRLEGLDRTVLQSLNTVINTMTTTGYGEDAPWDSSVMNLFSIVIQLTGLVIGFFTLRVLVIPLWKRTPIELDERLTPKDDHVVVAEYGRDDELLLDELDRLGIEYVLVDSDDDEAKALSDKGYEAIAGDPEQEDVLERASIRKANLVVADAGTRNVSIVLSAREMNEDIRTICLTDSASQRRALEQIGVDRVISPNGVVGGRLAQLAARPIDPTGGLGDDGTSEDGIRLDDETVLTELLVRRDSPIRGRRLGDTVLGTRPDVEVVGGWFDGRLELSPAPSDRVTGNSVVVILGPKTAIDEVRSEVAGVRSRRQHTRFVVAGMGEGGSAALTALPDGADVTTIDVAEGPDVDVVGDVSDPETLEAAGIAEASALVVTVDEDATALLTVALARTMTDDIEIFARVTDADKVNNAYEAGADYVLSVQDVSARLLASDIHGEDVLDPTGQIRTVQVDATPFAGDTLAEADESGRGEFRVVGVVRDERFLIDDGVVVAEDDVAVLVGTDAAIQEFERSVS